MLRSLKDGPHHRMEEVHLIGNISESGKDPMREQPCEESERAGELHGGEQQGECRQQGEEKALAQGERCVKDDGI